MASSAFATGPAARRRVFRGYGCERTPTDVMARQAAKLLTDLRPRPAFYVRLLDASHPDHAAVERFFRDVVDDVVVERGFTPHEMGRGSPQAAFINVEILRPYTGPVLSLPI
jgi:hypothetical protein